MLTINKELVRMNRAGRKLRLALYGVGKMGRALIAQMSTIPAMCPSVIVSRTEDKAVKALLNSGVKLMHITKTDDPEKARAEVLADHFVVTADPYLPMAMREIDAIVDATGNPDFGTEITLAAIEAKKDIITLNVEMDSAVGPELLRRAEKAGVVYTLSAGDEPGAIMELVDFALGVGFDLLAVGKGKNNPLDRSATAEKLADTAREKGLSPKMLTGFVDGTNTMIELTTVGNAIGFVPDVPGCHGPEADVEDLSKIFTRKEDGGILSGYGIVDYAFGVAPGVFALVTSKRDDVKSLMHYLGMGEGPVFALLRPYHLTSLETPSSIYRAVIDRDVTLAPFAGQVCDTVAVAKRDLAPGEVVEGIGGEHLYGMILSHMTTLEEAYIPMALVEGATLVRPVRKGEYLRQGDLALPDNTIVRLRKEQDEKEEL